MQNQLNKIAVVKLAPHLTRGVVTREITDPDFDVPTTIAKFGKWLYAVNARFGTASGAGRDVSGRPGAPLGRTSNEGCEAPPQPPKPEVSSSAAEGVTACVRRRHRSAPLPVSSGSD